MIKDELDAILRKAVEVGASDIHFRTGEVPAFRIDGKIIKSKLPLVNEESMVDIINSTVPYSLQEKLYKSTDADYSYRIPGVSRFRFNVAMSFGRHAITIRVIPFEIPSFESLKLPSKIESFTQFENGIILVTGVTGSGKSTTIASILEHINQTKRKHIVTIEDPIEYVYKNKKSIFTQRQIGLDTPDYSTGLKYVLRQDPDVILIGEIRDSETVRNALYAAETGHLVFATLHTFNAVQTINRVLSFFDPPERDAVRAQFSEVFRGSLAQKLLPLASGKGRVPAIELLFTTPTIKDYIKKDNLEEIHNMIQKGNYNDMITFNTSLFNLFKSGQVTKEVALESSDTPNDLLRMIRGVY